MLEDGSNLLQVMIAVCVMRRESASTCPYTYTVLYVHIGYSLRA